MSQSQVFLEDCIEGMKRYPDKHFDLAVVDPPYGIGIAKWDTKPTDQYWNELWRVSKNQIVWGANYFHLPHSEAWICWDKTLSNGKTALGANYKSQFELAWTSFIDRKSTFLRYTYDGNIHGFNGGRVDYTFKSIHPTQKPVALYDWIFKNYAKEGGKVLDTHGGSMSSLIAGIRAENIEMTVFEIDKDYFNESKKRVQDFLKQKDAFRKEHEVIFVG